MKLNDYQLQALKTATYKDLQTQLICSTLGLTGEAGEFSEKIKKIIRGDYSLLDVKLDCAKELGDVLWYLSACANAIGFDLEKIAQLNIDKLQSRKERGVIKGEGDNR